MSACGMRAWRGDELADDLLMMKRAFPDRKKAFGAIATHAELRVLLKEWADDGDPEAHKWWVAECASQRLREMPALRGGHVHSSARA